MPSHPFRRINMMMAAAVALMAGSYASMPGLKVASMDAAIDVLGPYKSNGKGKTKHHDRGGTRASQRAAMKRRNKLKHKKACRG